MDEHAGRNAQQLYPPPTPSPPLPPCCVLTCVPPPGPAARPGWCTRRGGCWCRPRPRQSRGGSSSLWLCVSCGPARPLEALLGLWGVLRGLGWGTATRNLRGRGGAGCERQRKERGGGDPPVRGRAPQGVSWPPHERGRRGEKPHAPRRRTRRKLRGARRGQAAGDWVLHPTTSSTTHPPTPRHTAHRSP